MTKELVIKRLKLLSENKGVQTLNYDEARIVLAEMERLNNIINELEKWLEERSGDVSFAYHHTLNKLQELKKESE